MSSLKQHKQSLFCRDEQSIKDYENAMNKAVQAISNWLKNDKMYTGGSIKQMRALIDGFKPSQAGVGVENAPDQQIMPNGLRHCRLYWWKKAGKLRAVLQMHLSRGKYNTGPTYRPMDGRDMPMTEG